MAILYWTDFKKPIYEDAPLFLTTAGKTTQEKQNYPHGYPDYHLLITVSGEGVLRKSDGSYRLTPDILMIHGVGIPLEYAPTKKPWVTAWLTFNGKDASKLFRPPFRYLLCKKPHGDHTQDRRNHKSPRNTQAKQRQKASPRGLYAYR